MTQVDGGGVPAGTQLNGIYEIDKRLAMGGMGEVYMGHVVQTGDKVAIKMILPEHANNELILDLFRKEASTLHNLYHEAIVRYYVFSVDPTLNRPYLAMEYAEGPALGDRVRTYPLSETEMSVLLPRIASGLHVAHKAGIIHRDLSPDNIILVGGDVNRAKIIDFGIAKSGNSEGTLIGSGFAGKLKYVSPEQLGMGGAEVTGQSDIYSLGLVLAEAATGQPLDMGGSQVEVIDKRRAVPDLAAVPAYIRPLINWMLQPDPSDRPTSMEVVANWTPATPIPAAASAAAGSDATQIAPRGFAQGAGGASAPPRAATPDPDRDAPARRRRRRPLAFLSLLVSGTAVAGTLAAVVVMGSRDTAPPDTDGAGGAVISGTGGTNGATADQGNGQTTAGTGDTMDRTGATGLGTGLTNGGDGTGTTDGSGGLTVADGDGAGTGTTGGNDDPGIADGAVPADGNGGLTVADGTGTTDDTNGSDGNGSGATGDEATTADDGDGTRTANADGTTTEPRTSTPGTLLTPLSGTGGDTDTGINLGDGTPDSVDTGSGPGTLTGGSGTGTGGTGLASPATGSAPTLGGGAPALSPPGTVDGTTPDVAGGETDDAPVTGVKTAPTLSGGDGTGAPSLTRRPVADDQSDPADALAEPKVARDGPGLLAPGGDTDTTSVPRTGALTPGGALAPTTPGSLDDSTATDDASGLAPVATGGAGTPVLGGGTPTLSAPGGDGGGTPTVARTDNGSSTGLGDPTAPRLDGGGAISGPSLTKTPVAAGETDPAGDLAEPTVTTLSPGGLSAPAAPGGDATTLASGGNGDGDLVLPRTGASAPGPATPEAPAGGTTDLAAVAAPKNQPPTIRSRAPDTLTASQGKPINMRLGEFFDEDGAVNLDLKIQGDVPNGLTIRMAPGGIAEMFGTPAEYGDYTIKVAAVDSAGLISRSITVALSVERPLENRSLRDYVLAYQGGDCFLSRPLDLAQPKPLIEVFLSEAGIPAVHQFDRDFKAANGVEANIRGRLISNDQCELVHVLDEVGPQALDNSLVIRLIKDQLVAGDTLAGKIVGGLNSRLFLFDNLAGVTDLSGFVREEGGETGFSVPISGGSGPQILIAARPRDGAGIAPDATLNQLLAAAQKGKASLALGFFTLK